MAAHYNITQGNACDKTIMDYVHRCMVSNQPISLIAIGGVSPLNDCLIIIDKNIKKGLINASDINIHITSVEASLYPIEPIERLSPVVNHNPAINPGAELTTERLKSTLKEYGVKIQHRSMFSTYHTTKISRASCAAISDDHLNRTQLMMALEARYGESMIKHILRSTDQYPVAFKECHETYLIESHSSFLHDLKAYFMASLTPNDKIQIRQ